MHSQHDQEKQVADIYDKNGVNAQSMLMNWVNQHQESDPGQPDEVGRINETSKTKRVFSLKNQAGKVFGALSFKRFQVRLVRTAVAVAIIGALYLGFQSETTTKLFFRKPDPVFDDVTLHPLDEINDYENDQKSGESQSSIESENRITDVELNSDSPIRTAKLTTENSTQDTRGAWLTGSIEAVETDQASPLQNQTRVGERVQYFRDRRN